MKKNNLSVQAFDYVQLAFSKYHNHQMHGCITFNGHLQKDILEQALNETTIDLPQLACRFLHGRYLPSKKPLSVELADTSNGAAYASKILTTTKVIDTDAQIRVVLLREKDKDRLVIVMNHMLCDGMGFKRYLYLLCYYYNQIIAGVKPQSQYKGKDRGLSWLKECRLPNKKVERLESKVEDISFEGGDEPVFLTRKLESLYFDKLHQYIKEKKVSFNDLFMAVYYVAIKEGLDYSLHTLYAPIDTRRYAKNPRRFGLCNQMGNLYTTIENLDDLSFLELLQAIHVQMESEKQSGNCLKELRLLHLAFRILPHKWSARIIGRSVKNPRVALTNLGIIDEKALSFQGVETKDCFISGSMKYASNLQMAVSTYQNEITFGVNMMVSPEDKKNISILLNSYRDILVRIAKGEL